MSDYQLTATDDAVIRTADQARIPNEPTNRDWQEYQQWLADGGVPDPFVPPPEPEPAPDQDHGETANLRIYAGVNQAVETYNSAAVSHFDEVSLENIAQRMDRLEATVKAMCDGQMLAEKLNWS